MRLGPGKPERSIRLSVHPAVVAVGSREIEDQHAVGSSKAESSEDQDHPQLTEDKPAKKGCAWVTISGKWLERLFVSSLLYVE